MPASPATICVVWHPAASDVCQRLASEIFNWFRLPDGDGIPVRYRSESSPEEPGGPPPNLPDPAGGWQWVVVLAEDHMVADPVWRNWLTQLTHEPNRQLRRIFPVALTTNAYNLPGAVRQLNFLRTADIPPDATTPKARADALTPRLLKDLTEAFCRVVAEAEDGSDIDTDDNPMAGAKVKVFLSHAKADSVVEARLLRDYLYRETQLGAFFDENDIALGYDFGDVLERALHPGETAALIVLQSDAYASRPWCRREILAFRRPRPLVPGQSSGIWSMNPTLVVQTMQGPSLSRTIAEIGTAPCVRWDTGREATIVTTLLREVLLAAFHLGLARQVPPAPGRVVINWRPDIPSLRRLQTLWPKSAPDVTPLQEVVYPQHSVPRLELDALQSFFPEITFTALTEGGASTQLTSTPAPTTPPAADPETPSTLPFQDRVIGLSISESEDLASLGFAQEHLREALLTVSRPLLRWGADLAYGGHLNDPSTSFTRDLIYLIAGEQRHAGSPTAPTSRPIGRLYNPQPWPHYTSISVTDEARWIDVCTFVRISQEMAGLSNDPAKGLHEVLAETSEGDPSQREAFNRALVNSTMRRLMVHGIPVAGTPHFRRPRLAATILLGGKTQGFSSVIPGVFEETLHALRQGIPVYLLGGFGGAAARLAEYLQGLDSEALQLEYLRLPQPGRLGKPAKPSSIPKIEAGFRDFRVPHGAITPQAALAELRRLLDQARSSQCKSLNNGLGPEENRVLFSTQDTMAAARLIQTGLLRALATPKPV